MVHYLEYILNRIGLSKPSRQFRTYQSLGTRAWYKKLWQNEFTKQFFAKKETYFNSYFRSEKDTVGQTDRQIFLSIIQGFS